MTGKFNRKLIASVLIAALCVTFFPVTGYAKTSEKAAKQKLDTVTKQKQKVYNQMKDLQDKIKTQKKTIRKLDKQVEKKDRKLRATTVELNAARADLEKQKNNLSARVRAMYKNGTVGYIEIILGSRSVSELVTNVEMVQDIYRNDQTVLDEIKEKKKQIQERETDLKKQKEELTKKQSHLESSKATLTESKNELNRQYKQLKKEEDALRAKIDAIEAAKSVTDVNGNKVSLPSSYKGGRFMWPVASTVITAPFGQKRSYESHPGIDISVATGTPVHAAAAGTITIAGWNGGYGYCVAISHGSGLTTIYGHNSQVKVKVGQHVSKGQLIALSGSTGMSTGPHCHFEVRRNGTAVNPMNYVGR